MYFRITALEDDIATVRAQHQSAVQRLEQIAKDPASTADVIDTATIHTAAPAVDQTVGPACTNQFYRNVSSSVRR